MRIVVTGLPLTNRWGIGRYTRSLLHALVRGGGFEVHTLVRSPDPTLPEGIIQHSLPLPFLNRTLLEQAVIPQVVGRLRPGLYLGADFTLPLRLRTRCAVVVHDLVPWEAPNSISWRARTLYRTFMPPALERADLILCDSRRTLRALMERFSFRREKAVVYPPPLSPLYVDPPRNIPPPDFALGRHLTGSTKLRPYLLYVGSSAPRKHLPLLVDAFLELHLRGEFDGWLVLAGATLPPPEIRSAPHRPYRPRMLTEWPVRSLGYVTEQELLSLYAHAELLVHLGHPEGYGYPVAEALAMGLPCVVPRGSAQAELGPEGVVETELELEAVVSALSEALRRRSELALEAAREGKRLRARQPGAELRAIIDQFLSD